LGKSGGDVLHVCQVDQKMDVVVQARGCREVENLGMRVSGSLASENERGPESGGLLFRVSLEQSVVCGSVPVVSDTLANDASK
jgi:hypothetical protein